MTQLIETLATAVGTDAIKVDTPVKKLRFDDRSALQWTVESRDHSEAFHDVILATPAAVTAELLAAVDDPSVAESCHAAAAGLVSIESASTAIVVLCVPKSQISRLPRQFGFVVPKIENRKILAVSFASHKYPIRCPKDHTIIRVFVGGAMQPELLEQSDESLIKMVRTELEDLIGMKGRESISRVVRWNNAMPQYHVGHLDRVKAIEDAARQIPHLSLVSNALRGVGIAPVVAAAKQTAREIRDSYGIA